jgi:two-component system, LytTR family, response regulator
VRLQPQLRILLVEHNPESRASLSAICAEHADRVRLIGHVQTGAEAPGAAEALRPDVLLLGARLPDMSGFTALRALREQHRRRAVLLTHTPQERLEALGAGALDFLMTPIEAEAFHIAMTRARGRFSVRKTAPTMEEAGTDGIASTDLGGNRRPLVLIAEREHRLYPLPPRQVDFIRSDGNYVQMHVGQHQYIARESISRLEAILQRKGFLRIERAVLLNLAAIAFIETIGRGGFAFTLTSGIRLSSGFAYRERILSALPLRRRSNPAHHVNY